MYTLVGTLVSPGVLLLLQYFFRERKERRLREEEMRKQAEEMSEFKLLALQCVITNRELELRTRLDAYDRYKRMGGNSWVDRYVLRYLSTPEE
jgi:hypothetical protein